jgi:hypothetical protein
MTVKRAFEFPPVEQSILKALYSKIKHTPKDGQWREFKGVLSVKGRPYVLECLFMLDGLHLNIRKSQVTSQHNKPVEKSRLLVPDYLAKAH